LIPELVIDGLEPIHFKKANEEGRSIFNLLFQPLLQGDVAAETREAIPKMFGLYSFANGPPQRRKGSLHSAVGLIDAANRHANAATMLETA